MRLIIKHCPSNFIHVPAQEGYWSIDRSTLLLRGGGGLRLPPLINECRLALGDCRAVGRAHAAYHDSPERMYFL
jgi:hypothetical protein